MTSFYLLDHKQPVTQQWGYPRRGSKLSGTAILHTAECAMDHIGEDSSAENCAAFINNRGDYGSYHVLVDSDSIIWMAPWEYETWQDSQTNPWAVGISAAVQADNWHVIPAVRRDRIYRNLAVAAADFVKYMKDAYGVTVPLKRINGAQARAGVPGFCAHGDSGVDRHDPGVQFVWDLFFKYTAEALGKATPTTPKEPFTVAQYENIIERLTAIQTSEKNIWAGIWSGGTDPSGNVHKYGILPIVAHNQTLIASLAAQNKALVGAIAALSKGEAFDEAKLLASVRAEAEAGTKAALENNVVSVDVNVNSKEAV